MKASKKLIAFCFAILAAFTSFAGDEDGLTVSPSFASQYMFRGVRLGGPTFQPSANFKAGWFSANLQAYEPIANRVVGQSDPEIDLYLGGSFDKGNWNFSPGATIYAYPKADTSSGFFKTTFEPTIGITYSNPDWCVSITNNIFYDVILEGPTVELGVGRKFEKKWHGIELSFGITCGTYFWGNSVNNSSPKVENRGSYFQGGFSLAKKIEICTKFKPALSVGLVYHEGFRNDTRNSGTPWVSNTAAVGRVVATVGLSWNLANP